MQTRAKCYGNFLNGCAFIRTTANNEQSATNTSNLDCYMSYTTMSIIFYYLFSFSFSITINSEPALFGCNWMSAKSFIFVIFRICTYWNENKWQTPWIDMENRSLLNVPETKINDEYQWWQTSDIQVWHRQDISDKQVFNSKPKISDTDLLSNITPSSAAKLFHFRVLLFAGYFDNGKSSNILIWFCLRVYN